MTDHCYIAVKGSLHSTDSCVFGLTTEEIIALSKRFSDSCKEVINGVLFKGNPIRVINVLGEIGYRVICSSGETEIVWTLRREVLVSKKAENQDESCRQSIAKNIVSLGQSDLPQRAISGAARKSSVSPLRRGTNEENTRNQSLTPTVEKNEKRKKPERIGSKPEDIAEYGKKGSTIDLKDLESLEENPPSPKKKVILNTNLSSEFNPLSARNLEPLQKKDFVTTYSETMANPAETTAIAAAAREDRFGRLVGRGAVIKPRCYMASSNSKNSCSDGACHSFAVPSVHQTLNEMDFDRGLWNAALFGEETRIRNMLDKGVSPDMEDASGYTALHYAARNGHLNICQALIKAGANVNMTTHSGRATALHRAAMCGHTDIVELLLNSGADPLLKDTDGRLALHRAAQAGHAMSASLLLNAAPQSATVPDLYGKFPACYAPGNKDLIKIFGQRT